MRLLIASLAAALSGIVSAMAPVQAQGGEDVAAAEARLDGILVGGGTASAAERVARGERLPVIVVLEESALDAPDVFLPTAFELAQRQSAVAAVRERLVGALPRAGRDRDVAGISARETGAEARGDFAILPGFAMIAGADALEALRARPEVRAIYEDIPVRPLLDETPALIGADDVWAEGYDGSDVAVAILDTGVELEHPMTGPAVIASACFSSTVEGEATSLCPDGTDEMTQLDGGEAGDSCMEDDIAVAPEEGTDGCFHGTHVASIAAGRTATLSGGSTLNGIARGANIVAVNVFSRFVPAECDDEDAPDEPCVQSYGSDQLAALQWLYANRDELNLASINMSLGGGEYSNACTGDTLRPVIVNLEAAGIATVIAAGNDRYLGAVSSPGCIPEAVTVGSTTKADSVSGFSNSSDLVDVLAPGSSILGAWQSEEPAEGENCQIQDSEPNSEGFCHWFATSSGTSMAAPHVAGVFALLRDAFPAATVEEILDALQFTGVQVTDPDTGLTNARIQVDAAYGLLDAGGAMIASVDMTPVEAYRVSGDSGDPASFATKAYTFHNTASAARRLTVESFPSWVTVSSNEFTIPAGAQRTLTLGVDTNSLPATADAGMVTLIHPSGDALQIPASILVNGTTSLAEFGPFEWTGDSTSETASVFRITGLDSAMPTAIDVAIDNPASGSTDDTFSDCSIAIRANRYRGNEYLVTAGDLGACPAFGRADLRFRIEAANEDVTSGLRMRRFATNASGGITDFSFDSEGVNVSGGAAAAASPGVDMDSLTALEAGSGSLWDVGTAAPQGGGDTSSPAATAQAEFGPFEWTGDATASTGSVFRIAGLYTEWPTAIDVAVANASTGGYSGSFSDCSLSIAAPGGSPPSEYLILQDDLSDCGNFGRADLTFRITADSGDIAEGLTVRRFASTADGGLTDFSFDLESSAPSPLTPIDATRGRVVFGPFEWTGAGSAATSNVFRIVGFESGMPLDIAIAIHSALRGGFEGKFSDCALTIRPGRQNGSEYLITQADLADCGDFGRGDLTFRIRANLADVPDGLTMRRFAVGADGDLTDFRFDHDSGSNARNVALPAGASPGMAAVEFGPFEWTGGAPASTRSVFRIAGLDSGAPERIDVALDNAATDGLTGTYDDCSLTVRAVRSGPGEFIIGSQDLADCGSFGRADISFRIVAAQADVDGGLTMRRFAVTTAGGLTDFGFDSEASGN
jgi:subtilisin family serine protease